MKNKIVLAACMCLLFTGAVVKADELTELKRQFEQQRKMMNEMEKRIEELEAKSKKESKETVDVPDLSWLKTIDWIKRTKLSGDIRYRHEYIDDETQATNHRNRNRIQARLKINAKVNDEVDATIRVASGSSESPTSNYQTLDGAFSSKSIWLDQAYADYHPDVVPGLHLLAGKMENPFFGAGGHQVIFDSDVAPEGGAITYSHNFFGDQTSVNVNGGGFWVDERGSGPMADTSLFGIQAYIKQKLPQNMHILGGLSYYDYGNIKDSSVGGITAMGNTLVGGNYIYDYDMLESFGEFGIKVGRFPIAVFGAYINNVDASTDEDTAWLVGAKFGKAEEPGSFEVFYDYREVESDAVVGGLCDSSFRGGGTDGKGHVMGGRYQLMKNWQIGLTYFHNEMNSSTTEDELNLLQADLIFKF
ncbi:MAG: putative porin [Desulfobacterales bacterium]|nr:putative porin [Desulfobacterales bacterium]